jgi:hypothetical protein
MDSTYLLKGGVRGASGANESGIAPLHGQLLETNLLVIVGDDPDLVIVPIHCRPLSLPTVD